MDGYPAQISGALPAPVTRKMGLNDPAYYLVYAPVMNAAKTRISGRFAAGSIAISNERFFGTLRSGWRGR